MADVDTRVDEILHRLREQGGRATASRRAILTALFDAGGHVTADELTARVQAEAPDVHESTVYRTLDALADLGVVVHVHLAHGPAVFHLAENRHHHLVCEGCGAVTEVPDRALASLQRRLVRDLGFRLDGTHFALTGHCSRCAPTLDAS
ncbi:MAG TPA: Fur family transcriptional regulator [Acidimicrobiales bacterium]|nr:Fur family transcriptional regulator [Acidimicrobiales bacterium]